MIQQARDDIQAYFDELDLLEFIDEICASRAMISDWDEMFSSKIDTYRQVIRKSQETIDAIKHDRITLQRKLERLDDVRRRTLGRDADDGFCLPSDVRSWLEEISNTNEKLENIMTNNAPTVGDVAYVCDDIANRPINELQHPRIR